MAKTATPKPATIPAGPTAPSGGVTRSRAASRMGDGDMFDAGPVDGSRSKRNPVMIGGGVLFAAIAMFAGALLLNARGERRAVVVSAREIPAGTVIQADMLRIEHIEADTQLRALPGPRYGLLVGKVARERIPAGVLVVEEQVGAALQPPAGFSLVAMTLEAGELPVASLAYGDNVQVVRTPQAQSADDPGGVISTAAVWSMWQQSTQAAAAGGAKRAVTLAVPQADAVAVTQAAARREIRLIAVGGDPVFSPRTGELGAAFPNPDVTAKATPDTTTQETSPPATEATNQPAASAPAVAQAAPTTVPAAQVNPVVGNDVSVPVAAAPAGQ